MNRRRFHLSLGSAAVLATSGTLVLQHAAQAQAGADFIEGRDYRRLGTPAPVPGHGKVDVTEFFWYGCPHCHALEPALEAWSARRPADAVLRRVPVVFGALHEGHARMFYALEALGQMPTMHRKVFAALHVQRKRLDKFDDMAAFVAEQGVDKAKFTEAYNAFGTASKVRQSQQLQQAWNLDGVPALGIGGRFLTAGSMAGSNERALAVADFLIARSRKPA